MTKISTRSKRIKVIKVGEREFEVEMVAIPFREGVELRCIVEGNEIRISDRQLGEHEALRLMGAEIRKVLGI